MRSKVNPALLGKLNERRILEVLQGKGPLSRADVTRLSGISAPTVSKAVDTLLRSGLLEEGASARSGIGRPAKEIRLASDSARVIGVVFDRPRCSIISAGLDGRLQQESRSEFRTPGSYAALLDAVVKRTAPLIKEKKVKTLGIGISMPGLINRQEGKGVLSPNLHLTDNHTPGADLTRRLGVEVIVRQESHALCLAERFHGLANGVDHFAMMDVTTGLGLGVWSGGRLLEGASGLAGELGHATLDPKGRLCGCGNRGCIETQATDAALARQVSERLKRDLDFEEVLALSRAGKIRIDNDLEATRDALAVAIGAAINIFNPSTLFVYGRMLDAREGLFEELTKAVKRRSLGPSNSDCRIVRAQGSKEQGAVAGIVRHLFDSVAPRLPMDEVSTPQQAV